MESLGELSAFVLETARACGLSSASLPKLELVLEELLVNVVHYAYPDGVEGDVAVECGLEAGAPPYVRISVEDGGRAFDPLSKEPPDIGLGLEERAIGGLGVHLARRMADSIGYERRGGRNILTFRLAIFPLDGKAADSAMREG